jgi:hypothetical protein
MGRPSLPEAFGHRSNAGEHDIPDRYFRLLHISSKREQGRKEKFLTL